MLYFRIAFVYWCIDIVFTSDVIHRWINEQWTSRVCGSLFYYYKPTNFYDAFGKAESNFDFIIEFCRQNFQVIHLLLM